MDANRDPSVGTPPPVVVKQGMPGWAIGCIIAAVALPVIIAVIGLLAAIIIPSVAKGRQASRANTCINNLRLIENAKEMTAIDKSLNEGASLSGADISPYLKDGFDSLRCPDGGYYTINPLGTEPECSRHGSLSSAMDRR